ncbi:GH92 family glycosyl hydrolase [Mediterranea massiliensis]|uniref:GH92 family glycosyl hydrolase n=1 Tax=Mediterranea massiliensis TaxID=1841865 RepID=UPI0025A36958|nr:GH92 family glycosyl hydrolase [Mediterranea massiliensis]MDM8338149.1 GH92 family glycosyl hydrolase [Mediterranea massiliensis]
MRIINIFLLFACCMANLTFAQNVKRAVDYVNPLMGTDSNFELSTGNTYPAIALPWGMNFWTPQTGKMGEGWTYTYTSTRIRGFKQTHQPSPWINDYGQFALMPLTGKPVFDENERASFFNHKSEEARPYYYKVFLADHNVTTEIVPTERAALFRFTFPETTDAYVVVDAFDNGSKVQIIPEERKIIGYTTKNSGGVPQNFRNYFTIVFDKPFTYMASVTNGQMMQGGKQAEDRHAGAIIGFHTTKGERVSARVASSFISPEQAEINLEELGDGDFERLKANGRERWNNVLGRIEIKTDNQDQLRTFYSCLYRSVLFPRMFHEVDRNGNIQHYSPHTGKVLPGRLFTDTGFWDSFRGLLPLVNLVYPDMGEQMQEGFLNAYRESGFFPEWASPGHRDCMVGNNSASVVADAFVKGIIRKDAEEMYEGLLHGANHQHPSVPSSGRMGYKEYNQLGYVPSDISQSAARTLEYAYNDWCIYRMGKKLGRPAQELELYKQRARNYRNLYYAPYKLMSGKDRNGCFPERFEPEAWWGPFTEGNSWHYSWSVFHDVRGLINLMGGDREFTAMLDSVFVMPPVFGRGTDTRKNLIHEMREMQVIGMGQYAHGNQPIQHMIYLYNYAGQPWKAQYWVREVLNRLYTPAADGYCGDEDNGQTSAWYIMSALGFYSVCPGSDEYVLGVPLFKQAVIHLPNGKDIRIFAPDNSETNRYIGEMKFNGKKYEKNYLLHSQLIKGATLKFRMDDCPNYQRGTQRDDFPYSLSDREE